MRLTCGFTTSISTAALLLAAPPLHAATTLDQDVTGVVGSELSLAVSTPPTPMTLTPSTDGSAATALAIVSTGAWTLSARDASATTPGRMDKVTCGTSTLLGGSLNASLAWSDPGGGGSTGSFSGVNQTVATGTLLSTRTITFTQDVGAAESVSTGDCYAITLTWTVS